MEFKFRYENGFYPEIIETRRLKLERVSIKKFPIEDVLHFTSSKGVKEAFETYPYKVPDTEEKARSYLEKRNYKNEEGENSTYLIRLEKSDYPFIGELIIKMQEKGVAELGFWVSSEYWGNGYCPEAAKSVIELLLNEKGFEKIEVQTTKSNEKAQRAIEKFIIPLGGEKREERETTLGEEAEFSDSDEQITVVEYEITNENYQK